MMKIEADVLRRQLHTYHFPLSFQRRIIINVRCICYNLTGGWWVCESIDDISGAICIEIGPQSYVSALDNGLFTVGALRDEGMLNCDQFSHDYCIRIHIR